MGEYVTTVTQKGQVTIPGELRRALEIKPKDRVAFELVDGEVRLRLVKSTLLAGYGAVKPMSRPEDFRKMRQEVEEEIAEEADKKRR
ncbi:MAG: AbrB/MazE/SpoVT family DNA-binding domain-containing protein [Chloroflexota bacterium]|nr:AbrB/MazE/SpoVT family DNA-binding domain-containing protein [Chloroflexota bacterium]